MKKKIIITISVALIGFIGNAQWQQTSLNTGKILSLAINGENIYAGESINNSSSGKVFLSTDKGLNWTDVFDAPSGVNSIAISSPYIYVGMYIGGSFSGGIFYSINNGGTWTFLPTAPNAVESLAASGTNIFVGTDHSLFYSSNNGITWNTSSLYMYEVMSLNISGANIFSGTHMAGAFYSNDNGSEWTLKGLTSTDIYSLATTTTSIFAGTDDSIIKSSDLGTNWIPVFYTGWYCRALAAFGTNIFAGTAGGGVFLSTDNGVNWTSINQGLTAMNVWSLAINDSNVYLGTDNQGIWKRPLDEILSSINENVISNVQVIINPNPLRTSAKLIINSEFKVANAELYIYDLYGQECKRFMNIKSQHFTIDRDNLSNGIYFYKLTQNTSVIAKGKLIVD